MDFVVQILQEYFNKSREAAIDIMLKVHHEGRGICGAFSKDVASTKVALVVASARKAGHPLQCVMEEI
jgi:ATP-dependent Clp protease adaptor protein ClpS